MKQSEVELGEYKLARSDDKDDFDESSDSLKNDVLDEEIEEEDEEMAVTEVFHEILFSLKRGLLPSSLVALMCAMLAYHITVGSYHSHEPISVENNHMSTLKLVRPVISDEKMAVIKSTTAYAETLFWLPNSDVVSLRKFVNVPKQGNSMLPQIFYDGVFFGITHSNSHGVEYTGQSTSQASDLDRDLRAMYPTPTYIMPRLARLNNSEWSDIGCAVYFDYKHLEKQGKLSSDVLEPWKRVLQDVIEVARNHKQFYVSMWYPHTFGMANDTTTPGTDPNRYKVIIQQVEPTRTGLNNIKSKSVVWLSAVNLTEPEMKQKMYRKPWTESDHWSRFQTPEQIERYKKLEW